MSQSSVSTFSLGLRPLFIGFHKSLASFSGHVSTFCAFTGLWKWCEKNDERDNREKKGWKADKQGHQKFHLRNGNEFSMEELLDYPNKGWRYLCWYLSCYTILSFWRVLSIVVTVHCAITITHMMGSKKLATFSSSNFFSWAKSGVQKLFPLFLLFAWLESIYLATASTSSSSFRLLYCL